MGIIQPYMQEFVLGNRDWRQIAMETVRDMALGAVTLPEDLKKYLVRATRGEMEVRVRGVQEGARTIYAIGRQLIYTAFAIACGVAALWITLIPLLGAAGVALAMAGLLLLIALIASVASWQLAKRRRKASRFAEIIGVLQKEGVADHIALLLAALFAGALAGSKKSAST